MGKEVDSISRFMSQIKNIGYYAGLIFGIGYCLTFVGIIAVLVESIVRNSSVWSGFFQYVSTVPWLMATLIFLFLGIICGIYFGSTIIRNSKSARDFGLKIDTITSSVTAFSFMLLLMGIGMSILAAEMRVSMFPPISGVAGSILLLIAFRTYRSGVSESKLTGAIIMLVSIVLIYFVAYEGNLFVLLGASPLFSEPSLEAIALLIATVGAVIFAFPILGDQVKQPVAGIVLSISGILFSCGVIYFNFSAMSTVNNLLSLAGLTSGWIPGFPSITVDSIWIIFFGFLLLGISGIIALITACLPLAVSVKQLSTKIEAPRPKPTEIAPTKPVAKAKYCTKCGASMPLDAVYCPKCAHKQPRE